MVNSIGQPLAGDLLRLQLSPAEEVLHVRVLGVEVVGHLLPPQLRLVLAVEARQLVPGRLGVEGRLRRLLELVVAVVAEDVVLRRHARTATAAAAAAARSVSSTTSRRIEAPSSAEERGPRLARRVRGLVAACAARAHAWGQLRRSSGLTRAPWWALAGALADLDDGALDLVAEELLSLGHQCGRGLSALHRGLHDEVVDAELRVRHGLLSAAQAAVQLSDLPAHSLHPGFQ